MNIQKTTQFISFKKAFFIALLIFSFSIIFVDSAKAADWKKTPAQCPSVYEGYGQTGGPGEGMCGVLGNTALWFSTSSLVLLVPTFSTSTNNTPGQSLGGYVVDCHAYDASPLPDGPFCDNNTNFWCSPDPSCNSLYVKTTCNASKWAIDSGAFTCVTPGAAPSTTGCISGYANCNIGTSDPNNCEVRIGVTTCTGAGGLQGTFNASCDCIVPASNFRTGIQAEFLTSSPLLWGKQYGDGDLIRFTNNAVATSSFVVFNSGQVAIGHNINVSTTSVAFEVSSTDRGILIPRLATNPTNGVDGELYYDSVAKKFKYYNGDTMTWGELGGGLPSGSIGQILVNNGGENWVTSSVIYVNTTTGRVGIGNTSPSAALNIGTEDWDIAMVGNPDSSISLTVDSGNSFYETYGTDGATGLVMKSVGTNMDFAGIINDENGFSSWGDNSGLHIFSQSGDPLIFKTGSTTERMRITSGGNVGIGTTTPLAKLHINDGGFISEGSYAGTTSVFMGYLTYKTGATSKLSFNPEKNYLKIGTASNTVWGDDIGDNSFSFGHDNIASGASSFVAGHSSIASGVGSFAFGSGNSAIGDASLSIGGASNSTQAILSAVIGGSENEINSVQTGQSSIIGGSGNLIDRGAYSSIISGLDNTISADYYSAIIAGRENYLSGDYSFIGGYRNTSTADFTFLSGYNNYITGENSTIVGGQNNQIITESYGFIGGGYNNQLISSQFSSIVGGNTNNILNSNYSFIGGGGSNTVSGTYSAILGGYQNIVTGSYSTALGRNLTVSGNNSFGVNVSSTATILSQDNTIALMGGNVGIGTTNPTNNLTIQSRNDNSSSFKMTNDSIANFEIIAGELETHILYNNEGYQKLRFSGDEYGTDNALVLSSNSYIGIGTANPLAKLHLAGDGAILATGTVGIGWSGGDLGAGTRLMWIASKGAFRAGKVSGTQWNNVNIGDYSTSFGSNNTASGLGSAVIGGHNNTASGTHAFIGGGYENIVSGNYSFIGGGWDNEITGAYSFIGGGNHNVVSGQNSLAFGSYAIVEGSNSFLINMSGINNTVSQNNVVSIMGGSVGIGTTYPSTTLHVAGLGSRGATQMRYMCITSAGATYYSSNACDLSSDLRLKKNIITISNERNVIEDLNLIRGVYFNWDETNSYNKDVSDKRQIGVIAQEIEIVLPELVDTDPTSTYKTVNYSYLTGFLIEVAKAQQAEIEALRETVSTTLNIQQVSGQLVYENGDLDLQNYALLNVKNISGANNKWAIDENGQFITRIQTSGGNTKEMFAMQSPYSEFVFSSSSELINGEAIINFDSDTCELIDETQPLKVNITLTGECGGIFVKEKSATGFVVKELNGGTSTSTFDWMVIAKRKFATTSPQSSPSQGEEGVPSPLEGEGEDEVEVPSTLEGEGEAEPLTETGDGGEVVTTTPESPPEPPIEESTTTPEVLPEPPIEEPPVEAEPLTEQGSGDGGEVVTTTPPAEAEPLTEQGSGDGEPTP